MDPVSRVCLCVKDTQRGSIRSHSVPVFCTCDLDMDDGSMLVALNRMREDAQLDVFARLKVSDIQQPCPPIRKRQKAMKAKVVCPKVQVIDADTLLLEEAILQNSADYASHVSVDDVQSHPAQDALTKEMRERFRAARAMHRKSWKPRFQVGDRVECNHRDGGWQHAEVVKVRYREREWEHGRIAAYQCRLDDGTMIYAPVDHDSVVREIQ